MMLYPFIFWHAVWAGMLDVHTDRTEGSFRRGGYHEICRAHSSAPNPAEKAGLPRGPR
jgi:hypothetical protein